MALKSMGSLRMSHDMEIWYRVGRSKMHHFVVCYIDGPSDVQTTSNF